MILTTYDVVKSQYKAIKATQLDFDRIRQGRAIILDELVRRTNKPPLRRTLANAPLFALDFHEITLDEAHNIKNPETWAANAVNHIKARHRSCLTGTPLQNDYNDLFSLFKFMRLDPLCKSSFLQFCFIKKAKAVTGLPRKERLSEVSEIILTRILAAVWLQRVPADVFHGQDMVGMRYETREYWLTLDEDGQKSQEDSASLWNDLRQNRTIIKAWGTAHERADEKARGTTSKNRKTPADEFDELFKADEDLLKVIFERIHEAKTGAVHLRLKDANYGESEDRTGLSNGVKSNDAVDLRSIGEITAEEAARAAASTRVTTSTNTTQTPRPKRSRQAPRDSSTHTPISVDGLDNGAESASSDPLTADATKHDTTQPISPVENASGSVSRCTVEISGSRKNCLQWWRSSPRCCKKSTKFARVSKAKHKANGIGPGTRLSSSASIWRL